jgi:hypothetical protein
MRSNGLLKSFTWLTLLLFSVSAHGQDTIPELVARGSKGRIHAVPSGKDPSVEDILKDIDIVVVGIVGESRSFLSDDQRDIYTDYEIRNATILYSAPVHPTAQSRTAKPVTVTLLGGSLSIGGITFRDLQKALPALTRDAEHLFLLKQVGNRYYLVGGFVGAFAIVERKLRPVSQKTRFAPEYMGIPSAQAVADLLGRIRAARQQAAQPAAQPTEPSKPMKVGGDVSAPKPISRWRTPWLHDPNQCYQLGVAVFEGVVDRHGNVRALKLIKGPDNEFTRSAREAMARQKFEPAVYRGKPVDVIHHVSINHVPVKKVKGPC